MKGAPSHRELNLMLFTSTAGWGGIGRLVSDISCRMPETVEQTILLLDGTMVYPCRGRLLILGNNCRKRLPIKGLRMFINAFKFRKVLKEAKPDAVLLFHHDARAINFLAQISLPMSRCRTILTVLDVPTQHRKYFAGARGLLHNLLISLILKHAHRIIATAEGVKADLVDGFRADGRKIDVVYAAVDAQKVTHMASEEVEHPWFREGIPIIVTAGRFVFQKNQADLLKAFALLVRERSCRLVLIGDGSQRDALRSLAEDLDIWDAVLFLGYQKNPFKFIARSTLFAFPSLFDAQPHTQLEAMAAGCPIVAYDCPGGTREILASEPRRLANPDGIEEAAYGILVPTGNLNAFAKAMKRLLDDPPLRAKYSQLGRERVMHFNPQDTAAGYLNAIMTAIAGPTVQN
jgi:glycosyltransferase involved in cell wall biosynthesis